MDPTTLLTILRKRLFLVLLPMFNAAAIAGFLAVTAAPQFESTVTLRILPYAASESGSIAYYEQLANTYSKILESDLVVGEAMRRLDINILPDFDIEVVPETELLRLSVFDESAVRAQTVANTLAGLLIEQNQASFAADSEGVQPLLAERLATIELEIDEQISELADLQLQVPLPTQRIADVERAIATLQQNYNMVLSSYNQVTLSQMTRANSIRIIEPAQLPVQPTGPGPIRQVAFGSVIGLLGGIVLALIAESRVPHYFSQEQIETTLSAPVISQVPRIGRHYRANVFNGDTVASEAFRRMRMMALAGEEGEQRRVILVTSAVPGEGKTTIAANFAAAIGLSGRRVVLVEGDMADPKFEKMFDTTSFAGLSEVLRGQVRLAEALTYSGIKNVSLLLAGSHNGDSTEYLSVNRLQPLVEDLLRQFDFVVIDAPAVLASTDALVLAEQVRNVLWVVDVDLVDRKSVLRAYQQIVSVGAKVFGVVTNGILHKDDLQWIKTTRPRPSNARVPAASDDLVEDVGGQ